MKAVKHILIAVVIVAVIIIAGGSIYTVPEDEYAVVTKFGRITSVSDS